MDWQGLALRLRQEAADWPQKELAAAVKLSQPTVSTYLSGKKRPSVDSLLRFAQVLEVSVDYLLGVERERIGVSELSPPRGADYVAVPVLAQEVAAGSPLISFDEVEDYHQLRHSRISHLLLDGVSPQAVAQMTGTSLAMLTRHYAHLLTGSLEAELARARERRGAPFAHGQTQRPKMALGGGRATSGANARPGEDADDTAI